METAVCTYLRLICDATVFQPSNVWFDRKAISISVPECKHSIDIICNKASELIHREVAGGIPMNRIVIGGFSMGGCLAMQLAYRFKRSLAGCVAMSSFLNDESNVYKVLMPSFLCFTNVLYTTYD